MCLQGISETNKKIEQDILQELFSSIDKRQSVVFNSGAGAGKTYALIECLKYIVNKYGKVLKQHNQSVICITYTNVAANHIKEKLGNSDIVQVSTIHERIWELIQQHQKQLLKVHEEKIATEIKRIEDELAQDNKYSVYQQLSVEEKSKFEALMLENKKAFNEAYTLGANEFRNKMPKQINDFTNIMKNVGHFKSLVGKIFKRNRLSDCLEKIGKGVHKTVEYNAMYNQDRLEWMRISHDTVLEYGLQMVEKYPILRQMIIDRYPYFLIDEYQDTSERVVKIMNILDQHGKNIHHDFYVAYFGDMVQNIYGDGIGGELCQIHQGLLTVNKQFNRRSFQEIIDVANKIRNDEIEQMSIYENCTGGSIAFYSGTKENICEFINLYIEQWSVDEEHPLHCFFTTNKLVAQYSGFLSLYENFSDAEVYSGANYDQLNTELLSNEITKLGKVQKLLYRLLNLYVGLRKEKTSLKTILVSEDVYNTDIDQLRELIAMLQERNGSTLEELLISIFEKYDHSINENYCRLIDKIFDMEKASYPEVKKYIQETLYPNEQSEEKVEYGMYEFFNTSIETLVNWYNYVSEYNNYKKVVYHTYHGTKGLEFNNVVIVMERGFGKQRTFFEDFFKNYNAERSETELENYESARNLLYVAVTRAIKNLRILYVDDLQLIEESVKKIFGKVEKIDELKSYIENK